MPYVKRDPTGAVTALFAEASEECSEFIAADDPAVTTFLAEDKDDPKTALAASDLAMARVTEDLIELLIAKHLIMFTELPDQAQSKLLERKTLRASDALKLSLVSETDVI